ncbi:unnamed protein product [Adineta ricciae]|uniref:F-box domain-containing protein n=1 Tax=Adineta ricciae TaxID=249248 RepID=A0A814L1F6_ADIRI|nr:unnamed protein product [Adineta ricciae]CAF1058181.1 unnamed protein product [Adineta ricciae]
MPSEIFLIIFRYIEVHDLITAFANLNSYFDSLLASSHLRVHAIICPNDISLPPKTSNSLWHIIKPQNLCSMKMKDKKQTLLVEFVLCHANDLIHLTSLTLVMEGCHIEGIIRILPLLVDLKHLFIKKRSRNTETNSKNSFLTTILKMKSLCTCTMNEWFTEHAERNFTSSNTIRKLSLKSTVSASLILLILPYMPSLRVFRIDTLNSHDFLPFPQEKFIHDRLAVLEIRSFGSEYWEFERLIHAAPNLRHLRISYWPLYGNDNHDIFLNPNLFKRLVEYISDVTVDVDFSTHGDDYTKIQNRIKGCSWLTLESVFDNYLDAETVLQVVFEKKNKIKHEF